MILRIRKTSERMSKITLGLWAFGNAEGFHSKISPREAKDIIKTAYKKGIHSFDSAFSYNTDSILYSALKEIGIRTESVEIFEKIMPYKTLRKKAEASLRALKTEGIEALIMHWPREEEEVYAALRDAETLVEEGKFLSLGLSNFPHYLFEKIKKDFDIRYNEYFSAPTYITPPEKDCRNLKYGIYSFGSLLHDDSPQDARKNLFYYGKEAYPHFIALKNTVKEIAQKKEKSVKQILFSFALSDNPYRVITGAGRKEHIEQQEEDVLEKEDYIAIMEKAEALSGYNKSDNIFSHDWKGR